MMCDAEKLNRKQKEEFFTTETIGEGKRRIIFINTSSGVDKLKEATLAIMGEGWEIDEKKERKGTDK